MVTTSSFRLDGESGDGEGGGFDDIGDDGGSAETGV